MANARSLDMSESLQARFDSAMAQNEIADRKMEHSTTRTAAGEIYPTNVGDNAKAGTVNICQRSKPNIKISDMMRPVIVAEPKNSKVKTRDKSKGRSFLPRKRLKSNPNPKRHQIKKTKPKSVRLTPAQCRALQLKQRCRLFKEVWRQPPKQYYKSFASILPLEPFDVLPLLALSSLQPVPFNINSRYSNYNSEKNGSDTDDESIESTNLLVPYSGDNKSDDVGARKSQSSNSNGRVEGAKVSIPPTIICIPFEFYESNNNDDDDSFDTNIQNGDDVILLLTTGKDGRIRAERLVGSTWQKQLSNIWTSASESRVKEIDAAQRRSVTMRKLMADKKRHLAKRNKNIDEFEKQKRSLQVDQQLKAFLDKKGLKSKVSNKSAKLNHKDVAMKTKKSKKVIRELGMHNGNNNPNTLDNVVLATAVVRTPQSLNPEANDTKVISATPGELQTILSKLSPNEKTIVQQFAYSRSLRHSTYRVTWKRGGKEGHSSYQASAWNISNGCIYGDASSVEAAKLRLNTLKISAKTTVSKSISQSIAKKKYLDPNNMVANFAATTIQAHARGHLVRKKVDTMFIENEFLNIEAKLKKISKDKNMSEINKKHLKLTSLPSPNRKQSVGITKSPSNEKIIFQNKNKPPKDQRSHVAKQKHLENLALEFTYSCSPSSYGIDRPNTIAAEITSCNKITDRMGILSEAAATLDDVRKHLEQLLESHPHYHCQVKFQEMTADFVYTSGATANDTLKNTSKQLKREDNGRWELLGVKSFRILKGSLHKLPKPLSRKALELEAAALAFEKEQSRLASPVLLHLNADDNEFVLKPTMKEIESAQRYKAEIVLPKSQHALKGGGAGGNILRRACCCCGLELSLNAPAALQMSRGPNPICEVTFQMVLRAIDILSRAGLCRNDAECFSAFRVLQQQEKWKEHSKLYERLPVCHLCQGICSAAAKLHDVASTVPKILRVTRPNDHQISLVHLSKDKTSNDISRKLHSELDPKYVPRNTLNEHWSKEVERAETAQKNSGMRQVALPKGPLHKYRIMFVWHELVGSNYLNNISEKKSLFLYFCWFGQFHCTKIRKTNEQKQGLRSNNIKQIQTYFFYAHPKIFVNMISATRLGVYIVSANSRENAICFMAEMGLRIYNQEQKARDLISKVQNQNHVENLNSEDSLSFEEYKEKVEDEGSDAVMSVLKEVLKEDEKSAEYFSHTSNKLGDIVAIGKIRLRMFMSEEKRMHMQSRIPEDDMREVIVSVIPTKKMNTNQKELSLYISVGLANDGPADAFMQKFPPCREVSHHIYSPLGPVSMHGAAADSPEDLIDVDYRCLPRSWLATLSTNNKVKKFDFPMNKSKRHSNRYRIEENYVTALTGNMGLNEVPQRLVKKITKENHLGRKLWRNEICRHFFAQASVMGNVFTHNVECALLRKSILSHSKLRKEDINASIEKEFEIDNLLRKQPRTRTIMQQIARQTFARGLSRVSTWFFNSKYSQFDKYFSTERKLRPWDIKTITKNITNTSGSSDNQSDDDDKKSAPLVEIGWKEFWEMAHEAFKIADSSDLASKVERGTCSLHGEVQMFSLDYFCKTCHDEDIARKRVRKKNGEKKEEAVQERLPSPPPPTPQKISNVPFIGEKNNPTVLGKVNPVNDTAHEIDVLLDKMVPATDFQPFWAKPEFRNKAIGLSPKSQKKLIQRISIISSPPLSPSRSTAMKKTVKPHTPDFQRFLLQQETYRNERKKAKSNKKRSKYYNKNTNISLESILNGVKSNMEPSLEYNDNIMAEEPSNVEIQQDNKSVSNEKSSSSRRESLIKGIFHGINSFWSRKSLQKNDKSKRTDAAIEIQRTIRGSLTRNRFSVPKVSNNEATTVSTKPKLKRDAKKVKTNMFLKKRNILLKEENMSNNMNEIIQDIVGEDLPNFMKSTKLTQKRNAANLSHWKAIAKSRKKSDSLNLFRAVATLRGDTVNISNNKACIEDGSVDSITHEQYQKLMHNTYGGIVKSGSGGKPRKPSESSLFRPTQSSKARSIKSRFIKSVKKVQRSIYQKNKVVFLPAVPESSELSKTLQNMSKIHAEQTIKKPSNNNMKATDAPIKTTSAFSSNNYPETHEEPNKESDEEVPKNIRQNIPKDDSVDTRSKIQTAFFLVDFAGKGATEQIKTLLQSGLNANVTRSMGNMTLKKRQQQNLKKNNGRKNKTRKKKERLKRKKQKVENIQTFDGKQTLLHIAVETENIELVELLLANNASTEYKDINGRSAFDIASNKTSSNSKIIGQMLQKKDTTTVSEITD